jgi:5'-nucleotidase
MMLDGRPVSLKQRYTVAINEFIADGGDNFTAFTRAADAGTIGMDLDALMEYFKKYSPVDAGPMNRITRVN